MFLEVGLRAVILSALSIDPGDDCGVYVADLGGALLFRESDAGCRSGKDPWMVNTHLGECAATCQLYVRDRLKDQTFDMTKSL